SSSSSASVSASVKRGESTEKSVVVKKEEGSEGDNVLARTPRLETGHSTEADDEAEPEPEGTKTWKGKEREKKVKTEAGSESDGLGLGTSYSGHTSREGIIRRRNTPSG